MVTNVARNRALLAAMAVATSGLVAASCQPPEAVSPAPPVSPCSGETEDDLCPDECLTTNDIDCCQVRESGDCTFFSPGVEPNTWVCGCTVEGPFAPPPMV